MYCCFVFMDVFSYSTLHLQQTLFYFLSLARDVPIWSVSVVLVLIISLIEPERDDGMTLSHFQKVIREDTDQVISHRKFRENRDYIRSEYIWLCSICAAIFCYNAICYIHFTKRCRIRLTESINWNLQL